MPEIFNAEKAEELSDGQVMENTDAFIFYCLLEAMSAMPSTQLDEYTSNENWDPAKLEVCLTINGVETPLRPTFDLIRRQISAVVEDRDKQLVDDKFQGVVDALYRFEQDLSSHRRQSTCKAHVDNFRVPD